MKVGVCSDNNQDNFQLQRFTANENIVKSFRGATFLTHTLDVIARATNRPVRRDHAVNAEICGLSNVLAETASFCCFNKTW